jgi:hypothetical protein
MFYNQILPINDPGRLYAIVEYEVESILTRIKIWKMAAFGPRMGRRTEMEWYEEVKVEKKFQYDEANREEIYIAIRLKSAYHFMANQRERRT